MLLFTVFYRQDKIITLQQDVQQSRVCEGSAHWHGKRICRV